MIKLHFFDPDNNGGSHPLDRHCNSVDQVIEYLSSMPEWDDFLVCTLLFTGDLDYDFADNLDQLRALIASGGDRHQKIYAYQSQLGA